MIAENLVAAACRWGACGALSLSAFERTLDGLREDDRVYLLRAWAATVDVANGDAGREIATIRSALERLRDVLKAAN